MKNINKILPWVITAVLTVSLLLSVRTCNNNKQRADESVNLYNSINDTLTVTRNKLGQEVAKIKVIEAASPELMTELQSKDLKIVALQELIKQNMKGLNSATILETETKVQTATQTVTKYVTINDTIYPVYYSHIDKDGWITGDITASKDTTVTNLNVKNEYDIVVKEEKGQPYAIVTNKNPYTQTKDMKTFNVTVPKPSPFGVGVVVGYGITGEGDFRPFVGAGLTYTIVRF